MGLSNNLLIGAESIFSALEKGSWLCFSSLEVQDGDTPLDEAACLVQAIVIACPAPPMTPKPLNQGSATRHLSR